MLSEIHTKDLAASGLLEETIKTAGFYSATQEQVKEILGFHAGPGLAIPYKSLNGKGSFVRIKPSTPFLDRYGKAAKYLSPKGSGNRLYIPPTIDLEKLKDHKQPLFITEGEKKALKACQEGLCCIAVPGVWSWKQRTGSTSVPIPDLDLIDWKWRSVYLVFDSDLRQKKEVATALYELSKELERRKSHVRKIDLPDGPKGQKIGLDDYLLSHSVESFCSIPHSPVMPPEFASIEIIPVTEFIRKTLPNREAIISRGILYPKSKLGLTGPGKKGKSMLVQNMVLSLAAGIPFLDQFRVPIARRVVYIQSEVSQHAMQDRLKTMIDSRMGENLKFANAMLVNASRMKIDTKEGLRAIQMIIEQSQAEVVVFDPLYKLHSHDENKADLMRSVVDLFDQLIDKYGCSIVCVHHHGKGVDGKNEGQLSRGSTVFPDWIDTQLIFRPVNNASDGRVVRKLSFELRNDEEPEPLNLELNGETLWFEVKEEGQITFADQTQALKVADELWKSGKPINKQAIMETIPCGRSKALELLKMLPTSEWEECRGLRGAIHYKKRAVQIALNELINSNE